MNTGASRETFERTARVSSAAFFCFVCPADSCTSDCCNLLHLFDQLLPLLRIAELVRQIKAVHRIFGVQHQAVIFRPIRVFVNFRVNAAPPTRIGTSMPGCLQILRSDDHLLRGFDKQAGQADRVRFFLLVRFDQLFRRHFDAEIDDFVAVVGQNDLDQVFADIVHVAFDRCEQ